MRRRFPRFFATLIAVLHLATHTARGSNASRLGPILAEQDPDWESTPHRCVTPHLLRVRDKWGDWNDPFRDRLRGLGLNTETALPAFDRPAGLPYQLDTDLFRIHFATGGPDAVSAADANGNEVPDFVESAAMALEESYALEVETSGYTPPPGDGWQTGNGGDGRYDVYLIALDPGVYGYVQPEYFANQSTGDNEHSSFVEENAFTSYMVLRNDFGGFEVEAGDALKVTAAHELFHAIQFGYDGWEVLWLLEATATWMEDEVFDEVNDNYQYLTQWFNAPHLALDSDTGHHWYGSWIFFRYLSEHLGGGALIREIFEEGLENDSGEDDYSFQTVNTALQAQGEDLESALASAAVANWLLTSAPQADPFTYEEAHAYRAYGISPAVEETILLTDSAVTYASADVRLDPTGAHFLRIVGFLAPMEIRVTADDPQALLSARAVVQSLGGSVSVQAVGASTIVLVTDSTESVALVVSAGHVPNGDQGYRATILPEAPLPTTLAILSTYPNPARDLAAIRFFTPFPQEVTLELINLTGARILSRYLGVTRAGIHEQFLEGRELPSGSYVIRMKGRDEETTGKITVVK